MDDTATITTDTLTGDATITLDGLPVAGRVAARTAARLAQRARLLRRAADGLVSCGDLVALGAAAAVNWEEPVIAAGYAVVSFATLRLAGAHRRRLRLSIAEHAPWLIYQLGLAMLVAFPLVFLTPDVRAVAPQVPVSAALLLAGRWLTYSVLRSWRHRGLLDERAVVIGNGSRAQELTAILRRRAEYALNPITTGAELGGDGAVDAHHLIVAPDAVVDDATEAALRRATLEGRRVYIAPRLGSLLPAGAHLDQDHVGAIPLIELRPFAPTNPAWRVKRLFDIVGSLVLLVLLLPVLLVAAFGVRLTSAGPVLFRQSRIGRNNRPFRMLKFRTYPVDHVDDKFSRAHEECPLTWGRFLRRTSIDELPQLFNVLKGEMSLVGPRPERPHFVAPFEESVPGYGDRHRVPGGMTGLAQVNGLWGDTSVEERVRFDNRYIDCWTLWRDIVILIRTVPAVLRKARTG